MENGNKVSCDIEAFYKTYCEAAEMDDFMFGDITLESYYQMYEDKDDSPHGHICPQAEDS